jgi:hypothetical protein
VLSDGINEWHKGVSTATGLCAQWASVTPKVPVYTVHYAPDRQDGYSAGQIAAGAATLKKLSSCTEPRGFAFDSAQDSTLGAVFRKIMGDL